MVLKKWCCQLFTAYSLCSAPPAACWAPPGLTGQPTINIFFLQLIFSFFPGRLSVFPRQWWDLCLPSALPSRLFLLTSIRQPPITGLSSSSFTSSLSGPTSYDESGALRESQTWYLPPLGGACGGKFQSSGEISD